MTQETPSPQNGADRPPTPTPTPDAWWFPPVFIAAYLLTGLWWLAKESWARACEENPVLRYAWACLLARDRSGWHWLTDWLWCRPERCWVRLPTGAAWSWTAEYPCWIERVSIHLEGPNGERVLALWHDRPTVAAPHHWRPPHGRVTVSQPDPTNICVSGMSAAPQVWPLNSPMTILGVEVQVRRRTAHHGERPALRVVQGGSPGVPAGTSAGTSAGTPR